MVAILVGLWTSLAFAGALAGTVQVPAQGVLPLSGEWSNGQVLPGPWHFSGPNLQVEINLLNALDRKNYGIAFSDLAPIYRAYLNGVLIAENGASGLFPKGEYYYQIVPITLAVGVNSLRLELEDDWGHVPVVITAPSIGPIRELNRIRNLRFAENSALTGLLLVIALQHLITFFLQPKASGRNKLSLYFSLFCGVMALRTLLMDQRVLYHVYLNWNWEHLKKLEFLSAYAAGVLFIEFTHALFSQYFNPKILRIFTWISAGFSALLLFAPIKATFSSVWMFQVIFVFVLAYALSSIFRAFRNGVEGAGLILAGSAISVGFVVNDVLYSQQVIHTAMIGEIGVGIFTLFYSFVIEQASVRANTSLTFFGRFIRPGLKDLLREKITTNTTSLKAFRGRQIPIMKLDIVDYTSFIFGMPYGLQRLFTDLWCSHVDRVLQGNILFDKFEGDGSIFYLRDDIPNGSCAFAISCAQKIMKEVTQEVDRTFIEKFHELVSQHPELKLPTERYLARYRSRTGMEIESNQTQVRFAFVYGYVDEGLWGLSSQSHYDLSGDLMILLSRIEKQAGANEFVASKEFIDQLAIERNTALDEYDLEWREKPLKGMGPTKFAVLKAKLPFSDCSLPQNSR